MVHPQNAPSAQGKHAGAYRQIHHEGTEYLLTISEYRVYSQLMQGGQLATFELSTQQNTPDPRSAIRYLRRMGIGIADVWCKEQGVRFKRYFIHRGI